MAAGRRSTLWLPVILLVALGLRLYGLCWDGGYLFHPDERHILVVADRLDFPWPPDWRLLLSRQSPWNPRFFAYGSLPIYILRISSAVAGRLRPALGTLEAGYAVGRVLAALYDVGSVYLIYRLGRRLYGRATGLLAAALLAVTVLHIQQAHFYTADTLLALLVLLVLWAAMALVERPTVGRSALAGASLGLALATKVSALPLAACIALALLCGSLADAQQEGRSRRRAVALIAGRLLLGGAAAAAAGLLAFALAQPYALLDQVTYVRDVVHEAYMARGLADVPYTRQYIGTPAYLYPVQQLVVWSLGPPLGIAMLLALPAALAHAGRLTWKGCRRRAAQLWVPLVWVLVYFGIVGGMRAKFLRYMLPVVPLLCLWTAWGLLAARRWATRRARWQRIAVGVVSTIVVGGTVLYVLAYTRVYRQEHPWLQATRWICEHVPPGSSILSEHWDDPLPLTQARGELGCRRLYRSLRWNAYDPDDVAKLEELLDLLASADYIVLSSNRLYGTIPRLPERYPLTSRYYTLLLAEELGFELIYHATAYPGLLGLELMNDTLADPMLPVPHRLAVDRATRRGLWLGRADESYSVYDHPMPLVFQRTATLTRDELLQRLGPVAVDLPLPR